jgi:hypothetical protein
MAQLLQKMQHVVPSLPLLIHGVERLRHDGHGWSIALGLGEVVSSVLVIGAFVRQVRVVRRAHGHAAPEAGDAHAAHGVDWVDLLLGAMLAVEVWAHWHESGHIKRPTVLLAVAMMAIGLLHGRIAAFGERRTSLRIDDTGVSLGAAFLRRFTVPWGELAAVEIEPQQARIVRTDGKAKVVNLRDLRDAAAVRAALEGVRLRLAPVDPGPTPIAPAPEPPRTA